MIRTCCEWPMIQPVSQNVAFEQQLRPCLVWAYSCRFYLPDQIHHECAPAFPPENIFDMFNPADQSSQVRRCSLQRAGLDPNVLTYDMFPSSSHQCTWEFHRSAHGVTPCSIWSRF